MLLLMVVDVVDSDSNSDDDIKLSFSEVNWIRTGVEVI